MSSFSTYKDLIVWQKAIALVKLVYADMSKMPVDEKYGLISQIKRSSISIPSNSRRMGKGIK